MTPIGQFFNSALIALAFLTSSARAQAEICPSIEGKVGIIIGGKGATTDAMTKCYPSSGDLLAVGETEGAQLIDCFVKQIDNLAVSPQKFVVVGHSSGSVHAEHIVQGVHDKNKVRLVLLEGVGSPQNQRGVESSCWYAKSGSTLGFNGAVMKDKRNCPHGATGIETPQCGDNPLCLHVSLVNSNTPADVTWGDVLARGLENCKGNRAWLGSGFSLSQHP